MAIQNDRLLVEKIKARYESKSKELSKLEELKALDKKVKQPAIIFAYIFGILGTLILGTGMCLAMKVIGDIMAVGIAIGVIGIIMVCITYPLFNKILTSRKAKYADVILKKSNDILNKKGEEL